MRNWIAFVFVTACAAQRATPTPTETQCANPDPAAPGALTYDNFGKSYLDANCNSCHSAEDGSRHGAPDGFHFDTLDEVRQHADRIFVRAAASNTTMPPGPNDPPMAPRAQLADWLACGAPN